MNARKNLQRKRRIARSMKAYDRDKFANRVEARLNLDLIIDAFERVGESAHAVAESLKPVVRGLYGATLIVQKPRWGARLN